MRITRLPIPLLIAAIGITSTAVIYVYLTAPPMPIHTDPNFTYPLLTGAVYLWRGAAFDYIFSSDKIVSISYTPAHHLIYLNGPMANITIGDSAWIVYLRGGRPLYVVKQRIDYAPGGWSGNYYFVFKLEDVTPPNLTIPNLSIWLPRPFDQNDVLSDREYEAVTKRVPPAETTRVLRIEVNGTHIIFIGADLTDYGGEYQYVARLPSPTSGRTIRITNKPISASYVLDGTTLSATALPYLYFAITPTETTTLVVYVS